MAFCLYGNGSADRVTIALLSAQAERNRVADVLHRIVQNPKLRSVAVFEHHFQPSVLVQVGERKGAAVFQKVQTDGPRNFRKCPVAIVSIENVALVAVPGTVRANELVDSVPSLLVLQRRGLVRRRFRDELAPEKAGEVSGVTLRSSRSRDIAVGDVDIRVT